MKKKKVYSLIILLSVIAMSGLACSQTDYGDSDTGFTEVTFEEKSLETDKQYSFTIPGESCTGSSCAAVLWQGTLDDETYLAIAVNNSHADNDFYLKIYFPYSSSFTEGVSTNITKASADYTVKLYTGGQIYSVPSTDLNIDITRNSDTNYTVDFTNTPNITLTSPAYTITNIGTIIAQKY